MKTVRLTKAQRRLYDFLVANPDSTIADIQAALYPHSSVNNAMPLAQSLRRKGVKMIVGAISLNDKKRKRKTYRIDGEHVIVATIGSGCKGKHKKMIGHAKTPVKKVQERKKIWNYFLGIWQ